MLLDNNTHFTAYKTVRSEMEKRDITREEDEYSEQILAIIRSSPSREELRERLERFHGYDIAEALSALTKSERERLLYEIGADLAADILAYLGDAGEYLAKVDTAAIANMIENMDAEDAKLLLDELGEDVRGEVLRLIEDGEIRGDIELLASYPTNTVGSRMSRSYIEIHSGEDIKGAMRALVAQAAETDNIQKLFVTDDSGALVGTIDLSELIIARSTDSLSDLVYTAFPFLYDTEPIDEGVERVRSYDEPLIPVIKADKALVGVISSADIARLVDEYIGDDYAKLAALGAEEDASEGLAKSLGKRLPWLIILLFLGVTVSAVVGMFEDIVARLPTIVAFQSLILGMAGNVGTQSLAVTVRGLVSRGRLGLRERAAIVFKETRVALLCGGSMGIISLIIVWAYLALLGSDLFFSLAIAACVGGAMCFAMMISGLTGAIVPLALHHRGLDPAVASGPLITTINDLVAVVSYYGLSWLLLKSIL